MKAWDLLTAIKAHMGRLDEIIDSLPDEDKAQAEIESLQKEIKEFNESQLKCGHDKARIVILPTSMLEIMNHEPDKARGHKRTKGIEDF